MSAGASGSSWSIHLSIFNLLARRGYKSCSVITLEQWFFLGRIDERSKWQVRSRTLYCIWLGTKKSSEDAHNDEGVPLHGQANVFFSHTWRYNFQDAVDVDTVVAFAEEFREEGREEMLHINMDGPISSQSVLYPALIPTGSRRFLQISSSVLVWLLLLCVMTPFEDPASVKRVWCPWELCLSIRFSKLHIALSPDQVIRFQETLLIDSYYVTSMMERIDAIRAEKVEAFDRTIRLWLTVLLKRVLDFMSWTRLSSRHSGSRLTISALQILMPFEAESWMQKKPWLHRRITVDLFPLYSAQ